jgi:hypothetical protein
MEAGRRKGRKRETGGKSGGRRSQVKRGEIEGGR